jgi:glycosyltransferase involved in cell wall biosynthesis
VSGEGASEARGRIAILVHASFPADPRVRRQADLLLANGYEVDVLALRDREQVAEERLHGMRIVRLPVSRRFTSFAGHLAEYVAFTGIASLRLAVEHRRRHYDLVQVATLPDFLVAAAAILKLSGVPLLLDLHEDMPAFFDDRFSAPRWRPLRPMTRGAARLAAAMADQVITVHEPLRQLSIERGVPADKIRVVMNSPDERIFDPMRHPRRPFMEDGELRLIHHSSLQRIYGLDVAIAAVSELSPDLPVRLDVYGDGPHRPVVEALVSELALSDRVAIHGRVPVDQLPRLLAAADIEVIPTLPEPYLQYSLSTKLLEAIQMGVPVIASDLVTFRSHFSEEALRYVPGGDPAALASAIGELARHPERAVAMEEEARRQATPYAWAIQGAAYLDVIAGLVAGSHRRSRGAGRE